MDSTQQARGTFEVHLTPGEPEADGRIQRLGFTKTWTGDLAGEGVGLMLAGGDPAEGDAGYVASEVVTGTLLGREGSFMMQQFGLLHGGGETLHYAIVPGSGQGALTGLAGRVDIDIDDEGVHHYTISLTTAAGVGEQP